MAIAIYFINKKQKEVWGHVQSYAYHSIAPAAGRLFAEHQRVQIYLQHKLCHEILVNKVFSKNVGLFFISTAELLPLVYSIIL